MSEYMICKGSTKGLAQPGLDIEKADDFLNKAAYWLGDDKENIWTFRFENKETDTLLTDAQAQLQKGVRYEDTLIYKVLNILMDNNIAFAMWYSDYFDDLDICRTKEDVLKNCYDGITDKSGMCEVYLVYDRILC